MYEPFFQLKHRPFLAAPVVQRYFPAAAIERARLTLMRCIQRAQGTGLILGPTGTGKTLLCNLLAEQFRNTHRVVLLGGGKLCTRRALLQSILFELRLPYQEQTEGALRLSLTASLEPTADPGAGLLLIVDEADTLPLRLIEELRMLTNIVRNGLSRVQLILSGATSLEERLANPKFESFNQRVAARCYLQPLTRDETFNYVAWQVQVAGGDLRRVFDTSALQAAYEATEGIPRLINQVCDYALHAAAAAGQQPVSGELIADSWAELQQIPSPWAAHAYSESAASGTSASPVIEFGTLDELTPAAETTVSDSSPLVSFELDASELSPVAASDEGTIEFGDEGRGGKVSATASCAADEALGTTAEEVADVDPASGSFVVHELPPANLPRELMVETMIGLLPATFDHPTGVHAELTTFDSDSAWPTSDVTKDATIKEMTTTTNEQLLAEDAAGPASVPAASAPAEALASDATSASEAVRASDEVVATAAAEVATAELPLADETSPLAASDAVELPTAPTLTADDWSAEFGGDLDLEWMSNEAPQLTEAAGLPELRIVRAESLESDEAAAHAESDGSLDLAESSEVAEVRLEDEAPPASSERRVVEMRESPFDSSDSVAPPAPTRRRRFAQLFTRLRRRRSA